MAKAGWTRKWLPESGSKTNRADSCCASATVVASLERSATRRAAAEGHNWATKPSFSFLRPGGVREVVRTSSQFLALCWRERVDLLVRRDMLVRREVEEGGVEGEELIMFADWETPPGVGDWEGEPLFGEGGDCLKGLFGS